MSYIQASCIHDTPDKIEYGLTNDYMFRAVFQKSNEALRHLVAAELGISYELITDCTILNPIILGEAISDKTTVMDIRLELNHSTLMDIEMQVGNTAHWPNRTLYYLSGMYRNLKKGQDYSKIKPAIHFSILTKSPFPDIQAFHSEYLLAETKTGHIYSRNFCIRMLCLDQMDHVSDEERSSERYHWARLFLASTWKEVQDLAADNEYLTEAASWLKQLTEEEKIKLQCEARERYYFDLNTYKSEGIEEGIKQGIKQGMERGAAHKLIEQVIKKMRRGKSPETIAEELEEPLGQITHIYQAAQLYAPEYDCESIYRVVVAETHAG